jgi:acetyltransferase-like isoleucine patch superfamily enzyme
MALNLFSRRPAKADAPASAPSLVEAASHLEDGAAVDDGFMALLVREMTSRAVAAGAGPDWVPPRLTGLRVRRNGLPERWTSNGNLMLVGPDAVPIEPQPSFIPIPPTNCLCVLGANVRLGRTALVSDGALLVVGDQANLYASAASVQGRSTILIGEHTTSTFDAQLDARNGGAILVGSDGMWANGVRFMTDDMHAIRDQKTGARLNGFGGKIVLEPHVWLGEQVQVMAGARIGTDTVIGAGALVKNASLPPNSVCVGRPAKPVRRGVTWSREDKP